MNYLCGLCAHEKVCGEKNKFEYEAIAICEKLNNDYSEIAKIDIICKYYTNKRSVLS